MANWRERALKRAEAARARAEGAEIEHLKREVEQLKREDEAESSGFFGGFLLGAIVGAILALVFAPFRGEEAREMVAERAVQLKDRATDLVAQVRGDGGDTAIDDGPVIEREIGSAEDRI